MLADYTAIRYERLYLALLSDDPQVTDNYPAAVDIALILKLLGENKKADVLLNRSLEYIGTLPREDLADYGIFQVRAYALRGDKEAALLRLREVIDAGWHFQWWFFMNHDAALDSLRDDPRFQAMQDDIAADTARQLANVRKLEASGEIALPPGN